VTALWTASELTAATGGTAHGDFSASGVSIDSRSAAPGDLFIALRGETFDGHAFAAAALAGGAAAAMVDTLPEGLPAGAKLLIVGDTLAGLTALGVAARARSRAKIIGVTGSVGKTGTKEALRLVLAEQAATHASASSFNNHWGLPLTLARMPPDTELGILELGMNHAGELAALSRIARPHVALITTVEAAHLGFFPTVEAIADAKAEIFTGVDPGGTAVLNRDNPHYARLAEAASRCGITRIIGFGEHPETEARLLDCTLGPAESAVTASIAGQTLRYTVSLPGRHWVMNSLGVLATVAAIGGDVAKAAAALGRLPGLPGRGQRRTLTLHGGTVELIDESYNANPASVRAALAVLGATPPAAGGRRIAVIGTMRELGAHAERLHAELAAPIIAASVDLVFTAGTDMDGLRAALPERIRGPHRDTTSELAPLVKAALRPGDVVMIKGSLGTRMADIVKPLLAASAAPAGAAAAGTNAATKPVRAAVG
jgi:UDP-N-acetylmuramoyl-tripeptide--D-alanyl-D-alanine ligase